MVLDLQGGDWVAGVGFKIEEGLGLGVGDSDGFCDAGVDGLFERFPGFAQGNVFQGDGGVGCVLPPCLFPREISSGDPFPCLMSGLMGDVQGILASPVRRI